MARYTFKMQRLFLARPLPDNDGIALDKAQSNYLVNVLRMVAGDELLVFNGRDGEWRARLLEPSKKAAVLELGERMRPQPVPGALDYCFAPLKQARLDYMVQKAVEMGAARLRPVITAHTQVSRLNLERIRANVIEAAEQCGILNVPEVLEPVRLADLLAGWEKADPGRVLIFCDEGDGRDDPAALLSAVKAEKLAIVVGPEGGFGDEERALLKTLDFVVPLPLGPRILRADTAAVAALALVQAMLGDWRA